MSQQGAEGRRNQLELVMESADLDIWEHDLIAGSVTRPARRIYAELGYAPAEISTLTEGIFSLVHPDDVASSRHALAEHIAGRSARYRADFRVRAKSGAWVWYANHGKIIDRDSAEPGRRFVGVTFNVDEAHRASAQRATLSRAVKLLSSCSTALLQASDEQALLESICALAVDGAGYVMAWVGFADDSAEPFLVPQALAGGSELHLLEQALMAAPAATLALHPGRRALREGRAVIVDDLLEETSVAFWRPAALRRGFRSSIALPLLADGVALGVLSIYAPETHAFSGEEVSLLEELAANLAYGIKVLRERDERLQAKALALRESERAQALLHHAGDGIHIIDGACRLIEANDAFCAMLDYPREQLLEMFVWQWDVALDEARIRATVTDLLAHPRKVRFETIHKRRDGSLLHVEVSCNAVAIGGATVVFNSSRDISERKYAEAALHRKQAELSESEARHRELLENLQTGIVVHRAGDGIVFSNPRACALLGVSAAQMRSADHASGADLQLHYVDEHGVRIAVDDYPANRVRLTRRPVHGMLMGVLRPGAGGARTAPTWLLVSAFPDFAADGSLTQIVVNFEDISARRLAEQKVQHMAFYDVLTGLPNRRLLLERLHGALAASGAAGLHGALLFIDLDKFKSINDLHGHDRGDRLLVKVAQRLREAVREMDTVARIGGDEFVVLLTELDADGEAAWHKAAQAAEKLRLSLGAPFDLGGHLHRTTPSIGATMFCGGAGGADADTLLRQADIAMYKAKDGGRNTLRFFSDAMQLAVETHATLEADLRLAVPSGQLRLHYQLQVDTAGRPIGAEALVRWIHPQRGMVSPLQFIGIAEESSLILDIGAWVLETACAQLALWSLDPALAKLTLAVNVSAHQFRDAFFVDGVAAVLARHGQACGRLKLELTESVVVDDVDDVVRKMHRLRAMGVALSMDDFGTGYSSLAYLKQLPLDQIKIDQSFTRGIGKDPNDAIMVKTIIDLARNFRLHVIAEGVETVEQLAFLRENGCPAYQGYLFGRPDEVERFEVQARLAERALAIPSAPATALTSDQL
jgi:diguanylate cyclase (GGDEF)-like protein/PAS domain S-box-containing protein